MPLLSEVGWIWEGLKLLLRFAPVAEKLVADRLTSGPDSSETSLEFYEQFHQTQTDLEAQLNDLRKQSQEQNLKLNQILADISRVQEQFEVSLAQIRDAKNGIARLWLWIKIMSVASLVTMLLVVLLLVLHH